MKHVDLLKLIEDDGKSYQKKPVVIQAVQLKEETTVETREGELKGYPGDFLIRGVEGEIYPCGEEIFWKTYTKVIE